MKIYSFFKKIFLQVTQLVGKLPLKYIVFESLPDCSDNTRAVFNEMQRRGIDNRYQFVWLCNSIETHPLGNNVIMAHGRISQTYYRMRAKCVISCNWFTPVFGKYQKSIYLCHGIPIKSLNGYKAPEGLDYAVGTSAETNEIQSKELHMPLDKFLTLGYPRNDALAAKTHNDISKLFDFRFLKIVVWYPTYRQHGYSKMASESSHALPIIHNAEIAKRINEFAQKHKMLIIVKPHFSQDLSYIKKVELSNIKFIDDSYFVNHQISSYEFVGGCDALITDYSSIYFDYLLHNKPIAAIWEDIEEYRANRGFAVDPDYYMKGAYKIYNEENFISFLDELAHDKDSMVEARKEIIPEIHKYVDFNSSARVVDFIEKNML